MAAHFSIAMGFESMGLHSSIDVTGYARALPKDVARLPQILQQGKPGYDIQFYDNLLSPIKNLKVKAGTEGVVDIELFIEYDIWEIDEPWEFGLGPVSVPIHRPTPENNTGTVTCGCVWEYSCTKEGELTIGPYKPEHSQVSDSFEVRIDSAQSDAKPKSGLPKIIIPRVLFSGRGTKANKQLAPVIAYLEVVDVAKPTPPTPTPIPSVPPDLLKRTFYFEKENQDKLDGNVQPENKLKAMDDWVDKVQKDAPVLFESIKAKYVMLHVTGYASPPGSYEYNSDISDARANYVSLRLARTLGTESVRIDRRAKGNRDAQSVPGANKNQFDSVYLKDRRVEIVIDANEAKAGMERFAKEKKTAAKP